MERIFFSSVHSMNSMVSVSKPSKGFFELTRRSSRALNLASFLASETTEIQGRCQVCHVWRSEIVIQNNWRKPRLCENRKKYLIYNHWLQKSNMKWYWDSDQTWEVEHLDQEGFVRDSAVPIHPLHLGLPSLPYELHVILVAVHDFVVRVLTSYPLVLCAQTCWPSWLSKGHQVCSLYCNLTFWHKSHKLGYLNNQTWAILLGGLLVLGNIGVLLKIGIGYC